MPRALDSSTVPYPVDRCVRELFSEQAARTLDAVALQFGDLELRYARLEARSNRLARRMLVSSVGPGAAGGLPHARPETPFGAMHAQKPLLALGGWR